MRAEIIRCEFYVAMFNVIDDAFGKVDDASGRIRVRVVGSSYGQ